MVPELDNPKLMTLDQAVERRAGLRRQGVRLVLTNGCFDLLHTGHLAFLRDARARGGALWVGINADESVKKLKGPLRPVQSQEERAFALAALAWVDGVFLFDGERLTPEIHALAPDVYVKAGDYTLETLNPGELEALRECGAEIRFLPFLAGFSTTSLIERIHRAAVGGPAPPGAGPDFTTSEKTTAAGCRDLPRPGEGG